MMKISTDDIWAEIDDAMGNDDVPEHAITVQDVMEARGVSEDVARRTLRKLEDKGWQTGKRSCSRGRVKYWWPGE